MQLAPGKKIYFLSDFHLGAPNYEASRKREHKLVQFLDSIKADAEVVFIIGDMFDFWYEYRDVVPKGYVRILGKLAELTDSGIAIHFFVGNHDMWMKDYFLKELNIPVHFEPAVFEFDGKQFYIGHGDGLGPGDKGYKFLKKIFRNPVCQFLFGMIPPAMGLGIANYFSRKSRENVEEREAHFMGEDKEFLIVHSRDVLKTQRYDYFLYGHRHLPGTFDLGDNCTYVNVGDWITHFTYAVFEQGAITLKRFEDKQQ